MRRKILGTLLATLMCAELLAGCGQSETATHEESAQEGTTIEETIEEETATPAEIVEEPVDVYVFIAASLSNTMEEIKAKYEADHSNVNIIYNADSSGTLQTQIEEGAQCNVFFSAATKQMDALVEGGYVDEDSVKNLLENKIVLIKPTGSDTAVTGFDNITEAASLALAGEDVPVGQYARQLFDNLGITDQVMAMEINEGANVTTVLTAVAERSNEVGIVYATDASSMAEQVEVIAEATPEQVEQAVYPVGLVEDKQASNEERTASEEFLVYLTTDSSVMEIFEDAGFTAYTE